MQAITGASREPSPLVARWKAMQYQKQARVTKRER